MRSACALMLVLVGFGGCLNDEGSGTEPTGVDGEATRVDPETGDIEILRPTMFLMREASTLVAREVFEGTFQPGDHWDNGRSLFDGAEGTYTSEQVHDLSGLVPRGAPVTVEATIDAPLQDGDFDLWLEAPDIEIWHTTFDAPRGGYTTFNYTLLPTSGDITLHVFYDEPETTAEPIDYAVSVTVYQRDEMVPPGVPMAFDVKAGSTDIELWFGDDVGAQVDLWGPDDAWLGTTSANAQRVNITIPADGAIGEYVIMSRPGDAPFYLHTWGRHTDEAPRDDRDGMRALQQVIETSTATAVVANEPATHSVDIPVKPLQVGFRVTIDDMTHGFEGSLEGPNGVLASASFNDDVPFTSFGPDDTMGFGLSTALLADGLVAGSHEARFQGDPHLDGEMSIWWVTYGR